MTGLYDNQGVLRFCGEDRSACLAYAELFGLHDDDFTLVSLAEPLDDDDQAAAA
jgi:hypothetical protein